MRLPERLPELAGRSLTAYRLLWWAILAISVIGLTAGQWRLAETTSRIELQIYGVGLLPNDNGDTLTFSPLSPAARDAGIEPESVLLAVDARPVSSRLTARNLESIAGQLDGPDGERVALRLRAPDGSVVDARVVRGPAHLAAADREAPVTHAQRGVIELTSSTLDALIVLAGAILLFWRRASDPVAALLSLGLLAVPANDAAFLIPDATMRTVLDNGLDAIPMICILLGMTVFPDGRFVPRWTLLIIPAIAAWSMLFVLATAATPLSLQLVVILPALTITISSLSWRYYRLEPGPPRQQVKWVMLGFAGFFASGMVQFALLFLDSRTTSNSLHFAVLMADSVLVAVQGFCIVGGLLVSLLRYRLYDADAAMSRSAVYAGLTVTLFAVFAASETLIQALGQQWFGSNTGPVGGAVSAGLAALLLVPLHHRLTDWAKTRFQQDLTRLRAELPELLFTLRDINDPKELAEGALNVAIRGVHAKHGAILLMDEERVAFAHAQGTSVADLPERLRHLPEASSPGVIGTGDGTLPVALPLISPAGPVGWLALGPHPDGSLYGRDDRKALEELAPPLARALAVAMERSRRDTEREAERLQLADRLARLEEALAQRGANPTGSGAF